MLNRDSVRKYGIDSLSQLNKGQYPQRFAEGGLVGEVSPAGGTGLESSAQTNNISINVTVEQGGGVNAQVGDVVGASSLESQEEARAFSRQIENAVVKVIIDQKRQGGLLS